MGKDSSNSVPRHRQVYQALLDRINKGEFKNGKPLPAERQLAEYYAVSRITIIKALSALERENLVRREQGRGTFVVEAEEPAIATGHAGITNPKLGRAKTIAFVCSFLSNPYMFNIMMGVAEVATRHHYNLQVISSSGTTNDEAQNIREAIARNVDGIIVYPGPGYENVELYSELKATNFPMVLVDRYYPQVVTDRVVFDDEAAGYQLTELLIKKNHQRIAVLTHYEVEATSVRDRLSGYRRALEAAGMVYNDDYIWLDVYSAFYPDAGEEHNDPSARRRLYKRLERFKPNALFAINQDIAERVIYDLVALNTDRIQQTVRNANAFENEILNLEIATISYRKTANYSPYQFTAAHQSGDELGREATNLLIKRLEGTLTGEPQSIKVSMQLATSNTNGHVNTPVLIKIA